VYGFKVKWLKESVECSLVKARGAFGGDSKWQVLPDEDPKRRFLLGERSRSHPILNSSVDECSREGNDFHGMENRRL